MILGFLFHCKNIFWICFSSSITEFRIVVNKAKCTIFEMVKDLKIVIFPFKISFLIHHSLITLTMFLIESQKFKSSRSFGLENLYTYIFMVSLVRSIFFILQSACHIKIFQYTYSCNFSFNYIRGQFRKPGKAIKEINNFHRTYIFFKNVVLSASAL